MSSWVALFLAGVFEVLWAVGLKLSHGLTRVGPTVATVVCILMSFVMFAVALKSLPFGTAYAMWAGMGAAGVVLVDLFVFEQPADALRIGCLALIVTGVIGLRLATTE